MKKIFSTLILATLIIGVIWCAGCTDTAVSDPVAPASTLNVGTTNLEKTANVIDTLDRLSDDANIVISDLSLNMALGMALAGATDRCQTELELYLGDTADNITTRHKSLMAYYDQLETSKVQLANSFWFSEKINLNSSYLPLLKDRYQAESGQYDFTNPMTADIINEWCAKKTNNLIKDVVSADQIADWASALINALYFKSPWTATFNTAATTTEPFMGATDGQTVSMMHATESAYLENEAAIGFRKPYADGITFIGILPKESGEFTMNDLDLDSLLASTTYEYDVDIGLPKFSTEFSGNLADIYKELGMSEIFAPNASTFDGIGRGIDNSPLSIGDIIHKTKIIVDEEGTEAAAVTVISFKLTSLGPDFEKERKSVILDRPFAFLIYDEANDQVLFAGKITDPKT